MCLICKYGAQTKEQRSKILEATRVFVHHPDGTRYVATKEQIEEIIEYASFVLATGVDSISDVWSIQWPNGYIVQHKNVVL